jgi:hypothetical protein
MPLINLPPGCRQVRMEDGTLYRASREGGHITVSDSHAKAIDSLRGNGDGGLLHATAGEYGARSKSGRWCQACRRLWYAWAAQCPRCGGETVPE